MINVAFVFLGALVGDALGYVAGTNPSSHSWFNSGPEVLRFLGLFAGAISGHAIAVTISRANVFFDSYEVSQITHDGRDEYDEVV